MTHKQSVLGDSPITVFLIHGYGASSASWDLVSARFPPGYVTAPIDLVGFGPIAPPPGFDFSIQMQAASLAEGLRARQPPPSSIVAHSMGAAVALIAILDFDLPVRQLILVDPLVYRQPTPFFIWVQTIPILSWLVANIVPPSLQVDLVLNRIYFDRGKIDKNIRRKYIDAFKWPHHRRALKETAEHLQSFDASRYTSRFHQIRCPVTIIWSRRDPLLSFELSQRFQSDLEDSILLPIGCCGHAPQEECPDAFIAAVGEALIGEARRSSA